MGILKKLFGHAESDLDALLQFKRQELQELGRSQAVSAGTTVMKEAEALLQSCSVLTKPMTPAAYVDLATALLTYPSELGFLIAAQFSELENALGYQPFGTIMTAVGNIDSLYGGMFVRLSSVTARPELARVLQDSDFRVERAGQFIAVAIIMSARHIGRACEIYREGVYGNPVKVHMERALDNCSRELAKAIRS